MTGQLLAVPPAAPRRWCSSSLPGPTAPWAWAKPPRPRAIRNQWTAWKRFFARWTREVFSFNDVPGSMQYLETLSSRDRSAKCALNVALLDGAGKRAKKTIHELLGLGFREGQHVTSFTIGIDKPDVIRKKVWEAEAFPVLKMKIGGPDDKANLQALREVAPAKPVRVDANEGWKTKEGALQAIEWLAADGHIQYVEQPMPASTRPKDWVWLKQRSSLPIFGDESYHLADDIH